MIFIILIILILLIFAINLKKKDKKIFGNILLIIVSLIVIFMGCNLYMDYQIGKDIKNQMEYQKEHNADSI